MPGAWSGRARKKITGTSSVTDIVAKRVLQVAEVAGGESVDGDDAESCRSESSFLDSAEHPCSDCSPDVLPDRVDGLWLTSRPTLRSTPESGLEFIEVLDGVLDAGLTQSLGAHGHSA